jgi:hypothetical protein
VQIVVEIVPASHRIAHNIIEMELMYTIKKGMAVYGGRPNF